MSLIKRPERLLEKILVGIEEAGIISFACHEQLCHRRYIGQTPERSFGRKHCMYQIPFIKPISSLSTTEHRIQLIELCEYKIEEYWKK